MKNKSIIKNIIWVSILLTQIFINYSISFSQFQQAWLSKFNIDSTGGSTGNFLAVDKNNNIYVAGYGSHTIVYNNDYILVKYNANGLKLWSRSYNGTGNGSDNVRSLALDESGNAYITGESMGINTSYDCVTIKYDSSGNQIWLKRYDDGLSTNDGGRVVKIFNNNIYVLSQGTNSSGKYNELLIKYDTAGNQIWTRKYFDVDDIPRDMIIDRAGNIYITGTSFTMGIGDDLGLIKYSSSGNLIWAKRFDYNNYSMEGPYAIAIDSSENICITGCTTAQVSYAQSILTVKYDSSGNLKWNKVYHTTQSSDYDTDFGTCIGTDKNNNVYVAGYTTNSDNNRDYITIKYKPNGNSSWVRIYNGPGNGYDAASSIAIDSRLNIYITGQSVGLNSPEDYFTIVYDSNGTAFWNNRHSGTDNQGAEAKAIKLDNLGSIIITGWSRNGINVGDAVTIKYSQSVYVQESNQNISNTFKLFQNYPNPFNPLTKIKFQVPNNSRCIKQNVVLKVYDILGKEVKTLVNEQLQPGGYEISFDGSNFPSGVYFYKLYSSSFSDVKKMILIK